MMYKKFILSLAACAVSVRATGGTFHDKVKDGKFHAVNQDPLHNFSQALKSRNPSAAPPVTPNVWTLSGKRWRKPTISLGEGLIPDEVVQELCSTARDPDLNTGRVTVLGYAGARTGYYADFEGVGRIHQFKEKDNFQCTGNVWWAPCNMFSDWKPPARTFPELRSFEGKPKRLTSVNATNSRGATANLTVQTNGATSIERLQIVLTGNVFQEDGGMLFEIITDDGQHGYVSYAECDIELPEGLGEAINKEALSRMDDDGILQDRRRLAHIERLFREEGL